GRDHRVGAVFEHHRAVADADRQRAAGAALADHGAHDRDAQFGHLQQVARDRLGLAALLRADARVRPGGVDEGQQRQPEALGHLHQPQRLAVTLRARHAEVAAHLGLGVAALLVADDHHAAAVDAAQAADDGGVVGIGAVAGQLLELVADHPDVVVGVRTRGVARQLRDLPRREVAEDLRGAQAQLVLQGVQLGVDVDRRAVAGLAQVLDLRLEVGDGLFEVEVVRVHRRAVTRESDSLADGGFAAVRAGVGAAPAGGCPVRSAGPGPAAHRHLHRAHAGLGAQAADQVGVGAHRVAAVEVQRAGGAVGQQQVVAQRGAAGTVLGEQRLDAVEHAGHAQVQAQVEALRTLRADLVEVPAAPRTQREATVELVLAQAAFDHQDAVADQQLGVLEAGLGEERAFDAPASVLQVHEGLRVATLAHAHNLTGDHHVGFRTPAAAFLRPRAGLRALP